MAAHVGQHPNAELLESATKGFGLLFSNDITGSKEHFRGKEDPFHLMGLGVCTFLEAVLGMETNVVSEASRCLALSETTSRKYVKNPSLSGKKSQVYSRFPAGMEWEILNADAVVLLGMTNALSETYMGYLQCMYALNNAHSKFTKLYKTVFPAGLPEIDATAPSTVDSLPASSSSLAPPHDLKHKSSLASIASAASSLSTASANPPAATSPGTPTGALTPTSSIGKGLFSRWIGGSNAAAAASEPSLHHPGGKGHRGHVHESKGYEDGPVEELIVSGTAFGYGLFNLVFSLLPKKVQGLVGFLGFQHDRQLALKALQLSASKDDVHGVFSGLVLMTYYGVVLLLSGWQADEGKIVRVYQGLVDRVEGKYPEGALWILNRAKIMRMAHDPEGAIRVLKEGLKPERAHSFAQADTMLMFELAWTLLGQRRFQEAADAFLKMTELNTWSHGTYYFIAAGCYFSLGNMDKAQKLLDAIPGLIDMKKMGGKDLPTEVFIKKKLAFYKEKQVRRGGDPARFVESVKISPAEELGLFWNNHTRIDADIAKAHIAAFAPLTPKLKITSKAIEELCPDAVDTSTASSFAAITSTTAPAPSSSSGFLSSWTSGVAAALPTSSSSTSLLITAGVDLDNGDEQAVRALLLGVCHRTIGEFEPAKRFFEEGVKLQEGGRVKVNTWVGGIAWFEWGVCELKELEAKEKAAKAKLEQVTAEEESKWKAEWEKVLRNVGVKLDKALGLSPNSVDLSSRLDSRVSMLKDEIAAKRVMLGI